jgi:tetratricopeptide (TPR) repeat protein
VVARRRTRGFVAAILVGMAAVGLAAGEGGRNPTVTVTVAEAALLERVAALAATNRPAAIAILAAHERAKASAALDFNLGILRLQAGDLEKAAGDFSAALAKTPDFAAARLNLGRVHLLRDKPREALAALRSLAVSGESGGEACLLMGHAFLLAEEPVSAESAFRQALLLSPDALDPKFGLAKCLALQNRYAEAAALGAELIERDPGRRDLWVLRANAWVGMDKPKEAATALEAARRLGVADPTMLATLGDLYANSGQPAEAAARYGEALAKDRSVEARVLRGAEAMLAAGDGSRAESLLKAVEAAAGEDGKGWPEATRKAWLRARANLRSMRGETALALADLERLAALDPMDGQVLLRIGDGLRAAGKPEEALLAYERAARTRGTEGKALARQARIEVERGRYERAIGLLEAAVGFEENPDLSRYLEQLRRMTRR